MKQNNKMYLLCKSIYKLMSIFIFYLLSNILIAEQYIINQATLDNIASGTNTLPYQITDGVAL